MNCFCHGPQTHKSLRSNVKSDATMSIDAVFRSFNRSFSRYRGLFTGLLGLVLAAFAQCILIHQRKQRYLDSLLEQCTKMVETELHIIPSGDRLPCQNLFELACFPYFFSSKAFSNRAIFRVNKSGRLYSQISEPSMVKHSLDRQ